MKPTLPAKKTEPSIRIAIDYEIMTRIAVGPLKSTKGRGAATWVRGLILDALDRYEHGDGSAQARELAEAMVAGK